MKYHKLLTLVLAFGLIFANKGLVLAQDDDDDDEGTQMEEMDEEEWQKQMDDLNAQKTQLQARLDQLNKEIDDLKAQSAAKDRDLDKCNNDLMALVGQTASSIADFRKKFEETEKKINSKSGTPADARKMYFDEITNDKARCLPEFADRYASMKSKLLAWEGMKVETGCYTVVKGDCLWKIAKMKYGNPYLWPAIWDANKDGVANMDQVPPRHKRVTNPNLIYPGQCLRIPTLTDAQKKEAEMRAHHYRYHRKRHETTKTETKTETKKETKKEEPKKETPKKETPKKETPKKDTTKKK